MLYIPRRNTFNMFDDMFRDPFFNGNMNRFEGGEMMKTDVIENANSFTINMDLPGYEKENIQASVEDGYLTVKATVNNEKNDGPEDGRIIRRERFFGECQRSFFVGEHITTEDISATFRNGTLSLTVPKKEPVKEIPEKRYIEIGE